jgi:alkylhydroperoxidase family enzyme
VARIPYPDVKSLPPDLQEWRAKLPPDSNLFLMISHAAATAGRLLELGAAQHTDLALPARLRELAALATGHVLDSGYLRHRHIPPEEQISAAEREAIDRGDHSPFAGLDLAVLSFATEMSRGTRVSDETFAAVRDRLSERELVELVQVVGYYWMFGQFGNVLAIDAQPYE